MRQEKIVLGSSGAYPLNGILTLPEDTGEKVPAAVLVHGSGPSNMDEKIGGLTPFRDIAEGLAARGIAVIRYDKRSYVHGRKMLKEKEVTVREETIIDALKAAELLRSDPRIDSERIFVIGHSMGAMLAPRIDAEGGNFRGLILMAGTPRTLDEVLISQISELQDTAGKLTGWIIGKQKAQYESMFSRLADISDEEARKTKMGNGMTLWYFKEMNNHPSSAYLKDCTKPVLILQGEKDFQATVENDFNAYRELLAGRENVTFRLYPGLNHAFVKAKYDSVRQARKEYTEERHIGPEVLDDIAAMIQSV